MWTAYDVLTLLSCLLACLLLLADVRDELLRACKPFLLRALENAGVLTRDEYERRAGLRGNAPGKDAKQEQLKGASAAGAFARGVAAEQRQWQQDGSSSSSGPAAGLSINASLPSPAASSSHSNGSSALSAPASSNSALTSPERKSLQQRRSSATPLSGTNGRQAEVNASPATQVSVDAAVGHKPQPLEPDRGLLSGHSLDDELEAAAAEKEVRSESRSSRSRNKAPAAQQHAARKSIIASPSNQATSPVQAPLAISVEQPQPVPTPLASASTVAAAAATDDSRRPSPALTAAASTNAASSTELDLSMDRHEGNGREISISQRGSSTLNQPSQMHAALPSPSQFGPHNAYAAWLQAQQAAATPAPPAIPLIAGVPLTSLTLLRSSDCGVPTEEYYSLLTGEKVAWRRGNIWDSDFIYTLTQGLELMKYGSWGRPHIRKIRFVLVPNTDSPASAAAAKDKDKEKDKDGSSPASPASGPQVALDWGSGYILLSEVTSISKGKTGSVFKRFAKDASIDDATCLSVVTPKRSLDLQVLSTKQQRMQEKRDLLAYGLGEVTGTRRMEDKDELTAAQRRKIVSASSSGSSSRNTATLPIPLQKIVESINSGAASAAGGSLERYARRGVLGNGIIAGSNSIPLSAALVGSPSAANGVGTVSLAPASAREKEYSLSTQRSQAQPYQPSVPSTPSVSHQQHLLRSAQSSPAAVVPPSLPPALFVPSSGGTPTPLASPQASGGPGSVRHGSLILPSGYGTAAPLSTQHRASVMGLPAAGGAGSHSYNHSIALMQQQHMMQQQQLQQQQQLAQRQLLYAQQANAAAAVAAAAAAASHHPHHPSAVVGVSGDFGSALPPPHFPPVSPMALYAPGVVGVSPVAGVGVGVGVGVVPAGAHAGYMSEQAHFDELMRNQQLIMAAQTHPEHAAQTIR